MSQEFHDNPFRGTPESKIVAKEALQGTRPFDIQANSILPSEVEKMLENKDLMALLLAYNWPTDETTCEKIGKRIKREAEEVAAVSKYCRAVKAKKDSGETSVH